jgi:hypothetical protein
MDDGSEALLGWTIGDMWRDARHPKLDYAISTHDVPQSFALAWMYQLPYGTDKHWGGNAPWLLKQSLGDWSLAGDIQLATGFPLPNPVQFSSNPLSQFGFPGPGLPNIVGNATPANRTSRHWINESAYAGYGGVVCGQANNQCKPFPFAYGNEPQRYTQLREADTENLDLSIAKEFGPPRIRTLIRADFLNALNHPIYGGSYNIGNCIDCGDVGQVFGTRNDPRNIQVAAKIIF